MVLKTEVEVGLIEGKSSHQYNEEVQLSELWVAIWTGKWIIVSISMTFAICSVFYALSIKNVYQSTAILMPASSSSSSSLTQLAGKFGGLASLAGVSLGGAGAGDKTVIAIELLKTWGFLEEFIQTNKLEVEVYAVNGWDKVNNKLLINEAIYDVDALNWVTPADIKEGSAVIPTSWKLFKKINSSITIFIFK